MAGGAAEVVVVAVAGAAGNLLAVKRWFLYNKLSMTLTRNQQKHPHRSHCVQRWHAFVLRSV